MNERQEKILSPQHEDQLLPDSSVRRLMKLFSIYKNFQEDTGKSHISNNPTRILFNRSWSYFKLRFPAVLAIRNHKCTKQRYLKDKTVNTNILIPNALNCKDSTVGNYQGKKALKTLMQVLVPYDPRNHQLLHHLLGKHLQSCCAPRNFLDSIHLLGQELHFSSEGSQL